MTLIAPWRAEIVPARYRRLWRHPTCRWKSGRRSPRVELAASIGAPVTASRRTPSCPARPEQRSWSRPSRSPAQSRASDLDGWLHVSRTVMGEPGAAERTIPRDVRLTAAVRVEAGTRRCPCDHGGPAEARRPSNGRQPGDWAVEGDGRNASGNAGATTSRPVPCAAEFKLGSDTLQIERIAHGGALKVPVSVVVDDPLPVEGVGEKAAVAGALPSVSTFEASGDAEAGAAQAGRHGRARGVYARPLPRPAPAACPPSPSEAFSSTQRPGSSCERRAPFLGFSVR